MHAPTKLPTPAEPSCYVILRKDGTEYATRPSYWMALLLAYSELRIGNFTIETRR